MKVTVKTDGFMDLDRALGELPKATGKNVMRRTLLEAVEPMRADAEAEAPVLSGKLHRSVEASTKLSPRLKAARETTSYVEAYMGPTKEGYPEAIVQEFGTIHHPPQPYMRPAWDRGQGPTLERIKDALGNQIMKAAARLARKRAKAGG